MQKRPVKDYLELLLLIREAAAGSGIASEALSISLYNDAVTEYKAGRDGPAIMLLEESALAHKSEPAFELLGDIYYKKTNFEKARFYYGKALALGPRDKATRGKLRKAMEGLGLAKREGSKNFAHFELRYDKTLTADIYHEYTHAVVSAKTNNNCPVWLSEGVAMWEEYKNNDAYIKGARTNSADKRG